MAANPFTTTTSVERPIDGNLTDDAAADPAKQKIVSDFITVQSLVNLSAMTGAISVAWGAMRSVWAAADGRWFPLVLCLGFGLVSLALSKPKGPGEIFGGFFIALLNSLVLLGAVVGANDVATASAGG